jgi:predicted tellurium resistance membrane protein TerC
MRTYDKDGNLTGYTKEPMSLGAWLFIIFIGVPLGIQIGIPILIALALLILAAVAYQPFLFFTAVTLLLVIGLFLGLAERKIRERKIRGSPYRNFLLVLTGALGLVAIIAIAALNSPREQQEKAPAYKGAIPDEEPRQPQNAQRSA